MQTIEEAVKQLIVAAKKTLPSSEVEGAHGWSRILKTKVQNHWKQEKGKKASTTATQELVQAPPVQAPLQGMISHIRI